MPNLTSESALEKIILCTSEASYGTDATPAAADAIETEEWKLEPAKTDKVTRNIDRAGLGGTADSVGAFSADISFKIPLTSSGTAGKIAKFNPILRACQFNAVIVDNVSVTHNLVSGDQESATIYYYRDDRLRRLRGFRGSAGFQFKNGSIPYISVAGMSLYAAGVDGQTPPAPKYGNTQTPLPITFANTPTFTFGGTDLTLINLDINTPGNVKHRNAPNQEEVRLSGRRNYSGKMTCLQRPLANFDPESLLTGATLRPLYLKHGTAAGQIAELTAGQVQIVGVMEGEEDGDATWELDINITATGAGDDDLVLKLT